MASFKINASLFSVNDDHVASAQNIGIESLLSSIPMHIMHRENTMSNDIRRERHLDVLKAATMVLEKANQEISQSNNISKRKGSTQNYDMAD